MSMAMLIICLFLAGLSFISFLFSRRTPTKMRRRITCVIALILLYCSNNLGSVELQGQRRDRGANTTGPCTSR